MSAFAIKASYPGLSVDLRHAISAVNGEAKDQRLTQLLIKLSDSSPIKVSDLELYSQEFVAITAKMLQTDLVALIAYWRFLQMHPYSRFKQDICLPAAERKHLLDTILKLRHQPGSHRAHLCQLLYSYITKRLVRENLEECQQLLQEEESDSQLEAALKPDEISALSYFAQEVQDPFLQDICRYENELPQPMSCAVLAAASSAIESEVASLSLNVHLDVQFSFVMKDKARAEEALRLYERGCLDARFFQALSSELFAVYVHCLVHSNEILREYCRSMLGSHLADYESVKLDFVRELWYVAKKYRESALQAFCLRIWIHYLSSYLNIFKMNIKKIPDDFIEHYEQSMLGRRILPYVTPSGLSGLSIDPWAYQSLPGSHLYYWDFYKECFTKAIVLSQLFHPQHVSIDSTHIPKDAGHDWVIKNVCVLLRNVPSLLSVHLRVGYIDQLVVNCLKQFALTELSLHYFFITVPIVSLFKDLPSLHSLTLCGMDKTRALTAKGAQLLLRTLPHSIVHLELGSICYEGNCLVAIASELPRLTSLKSFHFNDNTFPHHPRERWSAFTRAIAALSKLEVLVLQNCGLDYVDVRILLGALKDRSQPLCIYLHGNSISHGKELEVPEHVHLCFDKIADKT